MSAFSLVNDTALEEVSLQEEGVLEAGCEAPLSPFWKAPQPTASVRWKQGMRRELPPLRALSWGRSLTPQPACVDEVSVCTRGASERKQEREREASNIFI